MQKKSLSAGDYIASRCTKCKVSTNHTIVAMVGTRVVRVECNTCGSIHNYKSASEKSPKTRTSVSRERSLPRPDKAQRQWQELLADARPEQAIPYSLSTPMATGQLINHPSFGLGQVISTSKPNKMEVHFSCGIKLLRCTLA